MTAGRAQVLCAWRREIHIGQLRKESDGDGMADSASQEDRSPGKSNIFNCKGSFEAADW